MKQMRLRMLLGIFTLCGLVALPLCKNRDCSATPPDTTALCEWQAGKTVTAEAVAAFGGVSRENFEATLDLIDKNYGSMAQYMEKQLGFTAAEQQLRDKYLK